MVAAFAAAAAFGSLSLSELAGMRQLGVLCAAGEVLTAIAILAVTPEIGAWLERGAPPSEADPRWTRPFAAVSASRARARLAAVVAALPLAITLVLGVPAMGDAVVTLRPRALAPLLVHEEIYALFGGRPGQSIVLIADSDAEKAAARADRIAEALDPLAESGAIEGFDALSSFAPAAATQKARLGIRDALDLPTLRASLSGALTDAGFSLDACAPAIDAFKRPSAGIGSPRVEDGSFAWLRTRYLATDGDQALAVVYVRTKPGGEGHVAAAVRAIDPDAVVTGYPALERALHTSLEHDLPRVAVIAIVLVAMALRAALDRFVHVVLVLAMLAAELGLLCLAMRALGLCWHVYDALVLPVLVGITIDEAVFLLRAGAREGAARALATQGRLVATTALTTAAGFAALLSCRFQGLSDLGAVGAIGSVGGLLAALVVVPAGLGACPGNSVSEQAPS
jgi:predicted RND superfamily exporter protein